MIHCLDILTSLTVSIRSHPIFEGFVVHPHCPAKDLKFGFSGFGGESYLMKQLELWKVSGVGPMSLILIW
jgi:hypothetical protein